jgi:prephenate dehydrogenase
MADSIRRLNIDIGKTRPFTSPVYQIELGLAGRLLSQDPDLYGSILQQNPYVPEVLAACRSAAQDLQEIVAKNDAGQFHEFFAQNTSHFGKFCRQGMEETDALIECMVNR